MKISFGKFRGREIAKLPASYLCWLLRELHPSYSPGLRKAARLALAERRPQLLRLKALALLCGPAALAQVNELLRWTEVLLL